MKVELDLDTTQLELLDKNLKDCLISLTKEQQVELLQNYINTQLDSFREYKISDNYWESSKYEYTDFGKQLIDGLRNNIECAVKENIINRPDVQSLIIEKVTEISNNMESIIREAISKYIVDNLFSNKETLESKIRETIWNMK